MTNLLRAEKIAVSHDGRGLLPRISERLRALGVQAVAEGTEEARSAAGALCLAGLGPFADNAAAAAANREAFLLAKSWARRLGSSPGLFVVAQDTGGRFGRTDGGRGIWAGGMTGLAKTARKEWPSASIKAIDLECGGRSAEQLADALVNELIFGGDELEVGLAADGARNRLAAVRAPVSAARAAPLLERDAVLIISGGARGVTAACAIALAQATRIKLVLLGRTALVDEPPQLAGFTTDAGLKTALFELAIARGEKPSLLAIGREARSILAQREIRSTLQALRLTGADASYHAVDICDRNALAACLAQVREKQGPIAGLIHGAGVLADSLIEQKTREQFDAVFATKALGLESLLACTASDPLRLIALFSSVVARSGNAGQADYAMANEVLNRVALAESLRRGPACVVKSINWGPWEAGMVTPELNAMFRARGVSLLSLKDGAAQFVAELRAEKPGEVELVIGDDPGKPVTTLGAAAPPVFELAVGAAAYPCLLDHQVKGKLVVPAMLAADWFLRAGKQLLPGIPLAVAQLNVVKGIQLDADSPAKLHRLSCVRFGERLSCELRDEAGAIRYCASVGTPDPSAKPAITISDPRFKSGAGLDSGPASSPRRWRWSARSCYGDPLFHGPMFQVIDSLGALGSASCDGTLKLKPGGDWPMLLDGGLQLVGLWARQERGLTIMPAAVGEICLYQPCREEEIVSCSVQIAGATATQISAHLLFTNPRGEALARIRDVRMYGIATSMLNTIPAELQP